MEKTLNGIEKVLNEQDSYRLHYKTEFHSFRATENDVAEYSHISFILHTCGMLLHSAENVVVHWYRRARALLRTHINLCAAELRTSWFVCTVFILLAHAVSFSSLFSDFFAIAKKKLKMHHRQIQYVVLLTDEYLCIVF